MEKRLENHITHTEGEKNKLAYSQNFKDLIHSNPGVIKSFLEIIKELDQVGKTIGKDGIQVELIDEKGVGFLSKYYKASLKGNEYFIKETPYSEVRDTLKAKDLLKDIPWAEVVDFQLAYNDSKGRDFFVATWNESPTIEDYLKDDANEKKNGEVLRSRIQQLKDTLGSGYFDVNERNIFYDDVDDKLILFDLNEVDFAAMARKSIDKLI